MTQPTIERVKTLIPSSVRQALGPHTLKVLPSLVAHPRDVTALNPRAPVPENWHEDMIVYLAAVYRPRVYVELGVYECALFNRIVPYAGQLIGVDIAARASHFMDPSPTCRFVHATTQEFAAELRQQPLQIDMLFIDADHSQEAVRADFDAFFPFVAQHGLILLHDAHPRDEAYTDPRYCGDGYRAIAELSRQTDTFEMMTLPVHPGLTLCRKRMTHLAWQEPL